MTKNRVNIDMNQLQGNFLPVDVFFWLLSKGFALAPDLVVAGAQLDAAGATAHLLMATFKKPPDSLGDPEEYLLQRGNSSNLRADELAGGVLWNA